jgi:DNA-binding GntR family transcriptional regulator
VIRSQNPLAQAPRYELITQVMRRNIQNGNLPLGLVLLEGPISKLMQTSRIPVQVALRQLDAEGLITRFDGRGYLVGQPGTFTHPIRLDISSFDLEINSNTDAALHIRGMWKHVYDHVEEQVTACQIFGEFRVVETELAEYLGVSRTVARDVLARLHERGLIRKNISSHWIAGPLTARTMREKFELRTIVEPEALRLAAPFIRYSVVEQLHQKIGRDPSLGPESLEDALMEHCIGLAKNKTLVNMIDNNRLLLSSVNRALTSLGLPADDVALEQYRTIFDLIARHPIDSAAEYYREHLTIMSQKSLARMKIVALIGEQREFVPYLIPN